MLRSLGQCYLEVDLLVAGVALEMLPVFSPHLPHATPPNLPSIIRLLLFFANISTASGRLNFFNLKVLHSQGEIANSLLREKLKEN
jgi:hypothetical protein